MSRANDDSSDDAGSIRRVGTMRDAGDRAPDDDVTRSTETRAHDPDAVAVLRDLTRFIVPSRLAEVRAAIGRVSAALADVTLSQERKHALELAVGEAVMNAIEHGNGYAPGTVVGVEVSVDTDRLCVAVTDQGGGTGYLDATEQPDIVAKLRGAQSPRGWGLWLIRSLTDEVHEVGDGRRHTLTLEMLLHGRGDPRDDETTSARVGKRATT